MSVQTDKDAASQPPRAPFKGVAWAGTASLVALFAVGLLPVLTGSTSDPLEGISYLLMGALGLGAMPIVLPYVATMVLHHYGPELALRKGWPMLPTLLGTGAAIGVVAGLPFGLMFHSTSKGAGSLAQVLGVFALWGVWASWPAAVVLWRYLRKADG